MAQVNERPEPRVVAERVWGERYPTARLLFCSGSVVRGEGYPSSDLDLVVLFDHVPNAWRESFLFAGWPVEVFAHDAETLLHFHARDSAEGRPSLVHMIADSMVIPAESPTSLAIRAWARSVLASPPPSSAEALRSDRYFLTDLLHDFRDDRPAAELRAIACKLHPQLYNFVLKSRGQWLGAGKSLPRCVERVAPELGQALDWAFDAFFAHGDRSAILGVAQEILAPFGGELFDGFRMDAPATARVAASEVPWAR